MQTVSLAALLALLATTLMPGPLPAQTSSSLNDSLAAADAQADFDTLRAALEEAHGGLHRFVGAKELDGTFRQLRLRLAAGIRRGEFAGIVSEMLAALRDGHARFDLDSASRAELAAAPLFPLRVAIEDRHLVVVSNESPTDTTVQPGTEILRINGRRTVEVLESLFPKIPGDGFIETGRRRRLGRDFADQLYLFADRGAEFDLELRDGDGREWRTRLHGVAARDRAGATNPANATIRAAQAGSGIDRNITVRFPRPQIALLRIRTFDDRSFLPTLDTAFQTLRDSATSTLILDLRGNGGGPDELGAALVAWLTDRPFRYFDHIQVRTIRPSFATWLPRTFEQLRTGTRPDSSGGYLVTPALHPGVAVQEPRSQPFTGRLVVLIDGGTFSTAADVAAILRQRGRATFIGEETAGAAEGNTSGLNADITLGHSWLRVRIYMYGYWNAVTAKHGRGTMPDITRPSRTEEVLHGRDPALEAALALAR